MKKEPHTKSTTVMCTEHNEIDDQLAMAKQHFAKFEKYAHAANESLRLFLETLPRENMASNIEQLNLSTRSLGFLSEGITSGEKDREISMAAAEVKRSRMLNEDEADHLNYTAL